MFLSLLLIALASRALAGTWTSVGPNGGPINALVADPSAVGVLYAATVNGVYRSGNRGVTWLRRSEGLEGSNVGRLVLDPASHLTLYAVSRLTLYGVNGFAFKTTDGGVQWTRMPIDAPDTTVTDIAASRTAPVTLYAATSAGVFQSTDAGETWSLASKPLIGFINRLQVDPTSARTVYALTSAGIYRSDDGAVSWSPINDGLMNPVFYTPPGVMSLAIDPLAPSTLYAGTAATNQFGNTGGGVFRSTDRGAHWTAANTGLTNRFVSSLLFDLESHTTIYAAEVGGGGVSESSDAGGTWTSISSRLPTKVVSCLARDPYSRSTLYAGTPAGVFRTLDSGATWEAARAGIRVSDVTSLKTDGQTPSNVFAAGPFQGLPSADGGAGLFRSADGGGTWTSLGFEDSGVALAVDPGLPGHLVAAATPSGDSLVPLATAPTTFYRSADGGATWAAGQDMAGTIEVSLAFAGRNSSTVLATTCRIYVTVIKSVDGGATWSPSGAGLPLGVCGGALVAHPTDPLTLYTSTRSGGGPQQGVFRTTDGGATWVQVLQAFVLPLAIDSVSGSTLYAGASDAVYVTTDGAKTWTATSLPSTALDLAVDRALPTTAYAATDLGVFRTTDLGAHWTTMNDGLPSSHVNAIAIDSVSQTLFAGTRDSGVYKLALSGSQQGPCPSDSTSLCLDQGRFAVRVDWSTTAAGGSAKALGLTDTTGAFWFFSPDNLELVVKVLDGRAVNGHFWVFYGALTNIEYAITVTDTQTGAVKTYFNPQGQLASVADTSAF